MIKRDDNNEEKIKLNIKYTGVQNIDEMFRQAAGVLQSLDGLRRLVKSSLSRFKKSTFTHVLVDWDLSDSLHALFYFFSANLEDFQEKLELKLTPDPPYFTLNLHKLPRDLIDTCQSFQDLIRVLIDVPGKIEEIVPYVHDLISQAKDFQDRASDICKLTSMGSKESIKTNKRVAKNVKKILASKLIIESTFKTVSFATSAILAFISSFAANLQKIKEIGCKAREANTLTPRQLVLTFWPDPKKIDLKLDS